ncbi:phage terminase large subunit family protein [Streptobacillus moniliformis]|nr:phage terminase large subunit family protein [Streptobacillus moniliformis]
MEKLKNKTESLFKNILKVLNPPPKLTIDTWADNYRKLSSKTSAEPGKWNTKRVPYQKEVMKAISDNKTRKVVMMYGAQLSKTEILLNTFGFYADYDPSPIMYLLPTKELAKDFATTRLNDMILSTPQLKNKIIDSDSRDTITQKEFAGGYIVLVGSNSATELSSRPIRILLADEVDRFPNDVKGEGDPLNLAIARTTTFWNKKIVLTSTPTIKGESRIEDEFENSTQELYHIPCPKCGILQKLEWQNIIFEPIGHKCNSCFNVSNEYEWKKNLEKGVWIAQNDKIDIYDVRGFHISELYSPFSKWSEIIKKFKEAKGDLQKMKVFTNTCLGESFEEKREKLDPIQIQKRVEHYGCEIPDEVHVLTAGVDVQDDRLEIEVVGWGEEEESWGIYYKQFFGNPGKKNVWEQLDRYLDTEFSYKNGEKIKILCTCIDTGGHYTNEAYEFIKPREFKRIFGIKGSSQEYAPFIKRPTKTNKGQISLFSLGVSTGKETIMSRLKIDIPGPRYMHFPDDVERGYTETYFKGLTSENKVVTFEKGIRKVKWKVVGDKRNEPLDLRNYSYAALKILNPDLSRKYKIKGTELVQNQKKGRRMIRKGI